MIKAPPKQKSEALTLEPTNDDGGDDIYHKHRILTAKHKL